MQNNGDDTPSDTGTEEMEVDGDGDGDEAVVEMETWVLGRTPEETGKAPMVMEEVGTPVPIFDRVGGGVEVGLSRLITFGDFEEFVEAEDVLEAELEELGIAAIVFEARAREAEQKEVLKGSEPAVERYEVLREFEREAEVVEVVPRVVAM